VDCSGQQQIARSKGFTLLELCVVMLFALVTTAFAIPVVTSSLNAYRLNSAVTSMTAAIQSTRYQAISAGYPFSVVFDKAAATYQIKSDPNNTGTFANVGNPVPFGQANAMGQSTTFVLRPGGAVQSPQAAGDGTTTMTMTYNNKVETIQVSAYGRIQVTP
jgi:Tfp pilus assembly protein FimT